MPDASEISRMLADRIEDLCRELLPAGRAQFGTWRCGSLDGERGGSLSVKLRERPGQWFDFATGDKGDALALVKAARGGDMAEALRWSRKWLGLPPTDGRRRPQTHFGRESARAEPETKDRRDAERAVREAHEREEIVRRRKLPLDLFDQAVDPRGTDTEHYLNARRLELPHGADAIRHHPGCVFGGERVPCMVALFRHNLTDEPIGIQRTRLPPGGWVRGMKMQRMNLGPTGDGSIKIDDDANVLYGLTIGEGTETVLAGRMLGHRPAWATGGKGTIKHFPVLPEPVQSLSVHWEPDADADVRECLDRWRDDGRETIILKSLFGKDAADALWEGA
jgi:hypothetical protein